MKKNTTIIYLLFSILLVLLFASLFIARFAKGSNKAQENESGITQISFKEDYAEEETQADMLYEDNFMDEYPTRVFVSNLPELSKNEIPSLGIDLLEEQLTEYLDYYMADDNKYTCVYVEDTFYEDFNFPTFDIYVEDMDLTITCTYVVAKRFYHFVSRFNPNGE